MTKLACATSPSRGLRGSVAADPLPGLGVDAHHALRAARVGERRPPPAVVGTGAGPGAAPVLVVRRVVRGDRRRELSRGAAVALVGAVRGQVPVLDLGPVAG